MRTTHAHRNTTSARRGWKRCECPIFASGTLHRKFKRRNTGQWEFESARAVAVALERANSWRAVVPEAAPADESRTARITIEDATEAFLAKCRNRNIAPNPLEKYRLHLPTNSSLSSRTRLRTHRPDDVTHGSLLSSWKDEIWRGQEAREIQSVSRLYRVKEPLKNSASVSVLHRTIEAPANNEA